MASTSLPPARSLAPFHTERTPCMAAAAEEEGEEEWGEAARRAAALVRAGGWEVCVGGAAWWEGEEADEEEEEEEKGEEKEDRGEEKGGTARFLRDFATLMRRASRRETACEKRFGVRVWGLGVMSYRLEVTGLGFGVGVCDLVCRV